MPGTQGGSAPPRKRQPARRKPAPSVGSAIQKAAPKGPVFGAPSQATRRRQQRAVAGKTLRGNTLRPIVKKPKGGGGLLGGVERAVGGAAHLLYPAPKRGGKAATGRLPGAAAGGRTSQLDLPNSAVGIVLRSTASTVAQQPGRTAGDTAKSALLIPAGLIRGALHPLASAEAIRTDYSRRYAPAVRGNYRQFHRRQLREGAAPEVYDIAGLVSAGGSVSGRVAQNLASAGKLGQRLEKVATEVKPLRVAGGETRHAIAPREVSKNFYKNATRAAVDKHRGKVQAKRSPGSLTAIQQQARHEGSITYTDRPTPVSAVLGRKTQRAEQRSIAKRGGVALATRKAEQGREALGNTGTVGTVRSLTKDERRGLKIASDYGVRTPKQAVEAITLRENRIIAERAKRAAEGRPVKPLNDELPILAALKADAEKVFTPNLRAAVKHEGNRNRRLAPLDPGLADPQTLARTYRPMGDLLGVVRAEGESAVSYARRVRAEGAKRGWGSATYFQSTEVPKSMFAALVTGGRKAAQSDKAYTGELAATGRESHNPQVMVRATAQNIKRRFNWNLVGDTVDHHVLAWSKKKNYTAHELLNEVQQKGINPDSVRLWNPRLYREIKAKVEEELGPNADPSHVDATVEGALRRAAPDLNGHAINPDDFKKSGWQLVDKAAYDEVMGTVGGGGEGVVGRSYDIAKGKVSRVLLANPAWLGFQVASNVFTSGLAGVTPADFIRAQKFFGKEAMKDPRHAENVRAIFGVHGWYDEQRMLGSTANSRIIDGYRTLKETDFYRKAHQANPLDLLFFRPDNAQNNAFRQALMYNRLKRETYARMGKDASAMVKAQQRITGLLKGPPEDVMSALTHNRPLLEKYAKHVDDFLGNWTTYTAKERHLFSRAVMFYGFLRFSTRLAFYTMPFKHPIMSSILLQIGNMEKTELKRIFGTEPPPWEYGNFYAPGKAWGENITPKDRASATRYPLSRLVPFFNAVQYGSPSAVAGSLAPFISTAVSVGRGVPISRDNLYTLHGSTAYVTNNKQFTAADRGKIALQEMLNLSPYYRALAGAKLLGKQSSDSSLVFPAPVKYKDPKKIAENAAVIRRQKERGVLGAFRETLAPQFGTPGGRIIQQAQSFNAPKKPKSSGRGRSGGGGATFKLGGGSSGSGGSSGATFKLGGG